MGLVSMYLVLFNVALTAGWGQVLFELVKSVGACDKGDDIVPAWLPFGHDQVCGWRTEGSVHRVYDLLLMWQVLSLLEIAHAVFGFVRTKVMTTVLQVFSRIMIVFYVMYVYPNVVNVCRSGFFLMSLAWSVTEVIRYSWYACKEMFGGAPYILTWCRYTFFYILYPMGVYGEQVLALTAAPIFGATISGLLYKYFLYAILSLYIPFFPMLYMHMIAQRKKTLYPKKPKAAKKERGLVFPKDDSGKRSTSLAGANVIGAALRGAGAENAAVKAEKAGKKWRFGYLKHYKQMVYTSCESADKAYNLALGGVEHMYNAFGFVDEAGKETGFGEFLKGYGNDTPFHVGVVNGKGSSVPTSWEVPYKGKQIKGAELKAQCDAWAAYGTIEKDCAEAIKAVCENAGWMDLRGHVFILIGTGSAMGPFPKLMELGATVVAIDIPGAWGDRPKAMWQRLITTARNSPGKLIFPLNKPQSECSGDDELFAACGCNLMEQPAEIRNWLLKPNVAGKGPVTIGNYTYLDGDLHVKLSLCADAIISALIDKKGKDVRVAFLCTPTDLHVIPAEARKAAIANGSFFRLAWLAETIMNIFGAGLKGNVMKQAKSESGDKKISIVNGIAVAQGASSCTLCHVVCLLALSQTLLCVCVCVQ